MSLEKEMDNFFETQNSSRPSQANQNQQNNHLFKNELQRIKTSHQPMRPTENMALHASRQYSLDSNVNRNVVAHKINAVSLEEGKAQEVLRRAAAAAPQNPHKTIQLNDQHPQAESSNAGDEVLIARAGTASPYQTRQNKKTEKQHQTVVVLEEDDFGNINNINDQDSNSPMAASNMQTLPPQTAGHLNESSGFGLQNTPLSAYRKSQAYNTLLRRQGQAVTRIHRIKESFYKNTGRITLVSNSKDPVPHTITTEGFAAAQQSYFSQFSNNLDKSEIPKASETRSQLRSVHLNRGCKNPSEAVDQRMREIFHSQDVSLQNSQKTVPIQQLYQTSCSHPIMATSSEEKSKDANSSTQFRLNNQKGTGNQALPKIQQTNNINASNRKKLPLKSGIPNFKKVGFSALTTLEKAQNNGCKSPEGNYNNRNDNQLSSQRQQVGNEKKKAALKTYLSSNKVSLIQTSLSPMRSKRLNQSKEFGNNTSYSGFLQDQQNQLAQQKKIQQDTTSKMMMMTLQNSSDWRSVGGAVTDSKDGKLNVYKSSAQKQKRTVQHQDDYAPAAGNNNNTINAINELPAVAMTASDQQSAINKKRFQNSSAYVTQRKPENNNYNLQPYIAHHTSGTWHRNQINSQMSQSQQQKLTIRKTPTNLEQDAATRPGTRASPVAEKHKRIKTQEGCSRYYQTNRNKLVNYPAGQMIAPDATSSTAFNTVFANFDKQNKDTISSQDNVVNGKLNSHQTLQTSLIKPMTSVSPHRPKYITKNTNQDSVTNNNFKNSEEQKPKTAAQLSNKLVSKSQVVNDLSSMLLTDAFRNQRMQQENLNNRVSTQQTASSNNFQVNNLRVGGQSGNFDKRQQYPNTTKKNQVQASSQPKEQQLMAKNLNRGYGEIMRDISKWKKEDNSINATEPYKSLQKQASPVHNNTHKNNNGAGGNSSVIDSGSKNQSASATYAQRKKSIKQAIKDKDYWPTGAKHPAEFKKFYIANDLTYCGFTKESDLHLKKESIEY